MIFWEEGAWPNRPSTRFWWRSGTRSGSSVKGFFIYYCDYYRQPSIKTWQSSAEVCALPIDCCLVTVKAVIIIAIWLRYNYDPSTIRLRRITTYSLYHNCDSTTIWRYHDAFDYDGSDRNYDMGSTRLRYDYDPTTTYRAPASIRHDSTRAKNEHVNFSS